MNILKIQMFKFQQFINDDCCLIGNMKTNTVELEQHDQLKPETNFHILKMYFERNEIYILNHVESQRFVSKSNDEENFNLIDDTSPIKSMDDPRCFIVKGDEDRFCLCHKRNKDSVI